MSIKLGLAFVAAVLGVPVVSAQSAAYPRAPIRIVVGATPGGTVDTVARVLADGLTTQLKQPVVVDNRPGANGAIAADTVAKSKPDGYTLLLGTSGLTTLPLLQRNLPYQLNRDLQAVAITTSTPFLLFAGPASQAKSVPALISYAKANPLKLSVASGDGVTLMASELFKAATGISVTSVNYRGGPQMVADIAGGVVDYGFLGSTAVLPLAKAGRIKVLGVASNKRLEIAPEIPTLPELGVKGYFIEPWSGIMAPRGTDKEVVHMLEQALSVVTQSDAYRRKVGEIGSSPMFMSTEASAAFIANEQKMLEQVAAQVGLKPAD